MSLEIFLDTFRDSEFLFTVHDLCKSISFSEYEDIKKAPYWELYKERKVVGALIVMNEIFIDVPELVVNIR